MKAKYQLGLTVKLGVFSQEREEMDDTASRDRLYSRKR